MEDCLLQISCKAAAVNLLEKSHCQKTTILKEPDICFLKEDERGAAEGGTVPFYTP